MPVKVILNPVYLDHSDGLLSLSYYDAMAGCHMGLFPSYYEPWGYTPLEAGALGVAAVTSDLAGFGRFISSSVEDENPGIYILHRQNKSYNESVEELFSILYRISRLKKSDRVKNKINAKNLAVKADWESLIDNYIKAHDLALNRVFS